MLEIFKLVVTLLLFVSVVGLIGGILDSKMSRPILLIGATVVCSMMLVAFVWGAEIFSPVP